MHGAQLSRDQERRDRGGEGLGGREGEDQGRERDKEIQRDGERQEKTERDAETVGHRHLGK